MNPSNSLRRAPARGLSRRQVLGQTASGLVGGLLASAGLLDGVGEVRASQIVSLRTLLMQLDGPCDPSRGIRLMLPVEGPVISLLDVIHRYYHA